MRGRCMAGPLLLAVLAAARHASAEGASARAAYDQAYETGGDAYATSTNESGSLGWGESYLMTSLATMFRATEDPRYLVLLAEHATSVMTKTDAARKIDDYAGRSRPCWQSTKYSPAGQAYCWAVHSGMLLHPIADLTLLVKEYPEYDALPVAGQGDLASIAQALVPQIEAALAVFDPDWKNGPGSGEGHYIIEPGASFLSGAGQPLPLNMMNAMGRAQIALWQATGDEAHRAKAEALARYLKNRLHTNGAGYAWTYSGAAWTGADGEDISHASINVDFAVRAYESGLVFDKPDLVRFAATLFDHVHVTTATTHDRVDGSGGTNTYSDAVGRWLGLAPYDARVWPIGANQFRNLGSTSGATLLSLASITRYAPPLRDYSFYVADWKDLGSTQKATAYGANILIDPPDPQAAYALRIGYRAWKVTTLAEYDGDVYHDVLRMAAHSSTIDHVYAPFNPAIYFAYQGTKALYQFEDTFSAAEGIEIEKPIPVTPPEITTTSLPPATPAQTYATMLDASGDTPRFWRVVHPPVGVSIDSASGELSVTPAAIDLAPITITVRVDNDCGHAERAFSLSTKTTPSDGGAGSSGWSDAGPQAGAGGGSGNDAGDRSRADADSGCACSAPRSEEHAAWLFALAAVAATAGRARRAGAQSLAR